MLFYKKIYVLAIQNLLKFSQFILNYLELKHIRNEIGKIGVIIFTKIEIRLKQVITLQIRISKGLDKMNYAVSG